LHRFECNGRISRLQAQTTKALGFIAVGFTPDQPAFRRALPEIHAAGVKKIARQAAE